ncbi:hypothetical protein Avbf_09397 [Armadillidium vulgare]|nr:hypothetical protein Avbf_09397 [Armadillidium vulgare]
MSHFPFFFHISGCLDSKSSYLEYQNENLTEIEQNSASATSSFLNISFTPKESGAIWLFVNGVTSVYNHKRCIKICCQYVVVRENDPVTLHVESLQLPDGHYNLTGITILGRSSQKRKSKCHADFRSFRLVAHSGFSIEALKHLNRRDVSEKECSCSDCIQSSHEYFDDSGLLRFYYNISKDYYCSSKYYFSIKLLKLINESINTEEECLKLESSDYYTLQMMALVGRTRYSANDKVPIDFPNTPTGCYLIRTLKGVFHGFFWLEAKNIIRMESWNTTIVLTPRNFDSSVEVTWDSPEFPFNFTSWSLTLWYVRDSQVRCEGRESEKRVIQAIDPDDEILKRTSHTFNNLSVGFYCARLSPIDERCPEDGCTPRSSRTVHLSGPPITVKKVSSMSVWVVVVLVVVGIVVGVTFAVFCYSFYRSSFKPNVSYASVSPRDQYQMDPICVLVIWTRLNGDPTSQFENVVTAFKNLLRTYAKCKVIDYLDYTSMEWKERQHLMTNPTEWLHKHLQDTKQKIILIGSEGTAYHCHKVDNNGVSNGVKIKEEQPTSSQKDSLDRLLFPFVQRYLKESKDLASNYGRIFYIRYDLNTFVFFQRVGKYFYEFIINRFNPFSRLLQPITSCIHYVVYNLFLFEDYSQLLHCRFPDLSSPEMELEDIVPWMRFSIPNHLRNLTLKLRGYV